MIPIRISSQWLLHHAKAFRLWHRRQAISQKRTKCVLAETWKSQNKLSRVQILPASLTSRHVTNTQALTHMTHTSACPGCARSRQKWPCPYSLRLFRDLLREREEIPLPPPTSNPLVPSVPIKLHCASALRFLKTTCCAPRCVRTTEQYLPHYEGSTWAIRFETRFKTMVYGYFSIIVLFKI